MTDSEEMPLALTGTAPVQRAGRQASGVMILMPRFRCGRTVYSPSGEGRCDPPSSGSFAPMTGQNFPSPSVAGSDGYGAGHVQDVEDPNWPD